MKIRQMQPTTSTNVLYPVALESDRPVYIQVEYEGKSFTFAVRQHGDGLMISSSDFPIRITPSSSNAIVIQGPPDSLYKVKAYEDSDGEN